MIVRSLFLVFLFLACSFQSRAEEESLLEEVVVTAQKREQSLQEVPITVANFVEEQRVDIQELLNSLPVTLPDYPIDPLALLAAERTTFFYNSVPMPIVGSDSSGFYVDGRIVPRSSVSRIEWRTFGSLQGRWVGQSVGIRSDPQRFHSRSLQFQYGAKSQREPQDNFDSNIVLGGDLEGTTVGMAYGFLTETSIGRNEREEVFGVTDTSTFHEPGNFIVNEFFVPGSGCSEGQDFPRIVNGLCVVDTSSIASLLPETNRDSAHLFLNLPLDAVEITAELLYKEDVRRFQVMAHPFEFVAENGDRGRSFVGYFAPLGSRQSERDTRQILTLISFDMDAHDFTLSHSEAKVRDSTAAMPLTPRVEVLDSRNECSGGFRCLNFDSVGNNLQFEESDYSSIYPVLGSEMLSERIFAGYEFSAEYEELALALGVSGQQESIERALDAEILAGNVVGLDRSSNWNGSLTTYRIGSRMQFQWSDRWFTALELGIDHIKEIQKSLVGLHSQVDFLPSESVLWFGKAFLGRRSPTIFQLYGEEIVYESLNDAESGLYGGYLDPPIVVLGDPSLSPPDVKAFGFGFRFVNRSYEFELDWSHTTHDGYLARRSGYELIRGAVTNCQIDCVDQVVLGIAGLPRRLEVAYQDQHVLREELLSASARFFFGEFLRGSVYMTLQADFNLKYELTDGVMKFDGAGQLNRDNAIGRPIPSDNQEVNGIWSNDDHQLHLRLRRTGRLRDGRELPILRKLVEESQKIVDDMITLDFSYSYKLGDSSIAFSIQNLADRKAPRSNDPGGYVSELHDPRGRMYFVKFSLAF